MRLIREAGGGPRMFLKLYPRQHWIAKMLSSKATYFTAVPA